MIIDRIAKQAKKTPNKRALSIKRGFRYQHLTYQQLIESIKKTQYFYKKQNLTRGDRILLWGSNSPEWVVAFLSALASGIVSVPIDYRTSLETVKKFISQTSPKLAFISVYQNLPKSLVPRQIFFENLLQKVATFSPINEKFSIKYSNLAEIVFTSGTTGQPKGVKINHKNLDANVGYLLASFPLHENHRLISILPLSHMFEQIAGLLAPLSVGAQITYLLAVNPLTIKKATQRSQATIMLVVPEILRLFMQTIKAKKDRRSRFIQTIIPMGAIFPQLVRKLLFFPIHQQFGGKLNLLACGGAPLDRKTYQFWENLGFTVLTGYGATELTAAVTISTPEKRKIGSVGRPLKGLEIRTTQDGEIAIKGDIVTDGYWQDKTKTYQVYRNGWYYTGDMGKIDKEGFVYITGRRKLMIVLADGKKVFPEDIEKKLREHPRVIDACVVGKKDEQGEQIVAVLLTQNAKMATKIISEVNQKLEAHQQIHQWLCFPDDDFPRTHTLKIDRKKVNAFVDKHQLPQISGKKSTKDPLISILKKLAKKEIKEVNEETNLSQDLALDSLSRAALVAFIEEEMGIAIQETLITEETTVKDLKKLIKKRPKESTSYTFRHWPLSKVAIIIREYFQRFIFFPFLKFFARVEIQGKNNLRLNPQPAIFYFNHGSHIDAPLVLLALNKKMRLKSSIGAAADIWFSNPLLSLFATVGFNAFPVVRSGSVKQSLEIMGQLLDEDWNVIISPEGTRSRDGKLLPFKSGAGMMAVEMQVSLVPVKIDGAYEIMPKGNWLPKPGTIIITIGKPLRFKRGISYEEATKKMRQSLLNLNLEGSEITS